MRGTVSAELKDFEGAMQYVSLYANGEACIHERDEVALWYIQQFNEWAMANTLLYRLLSGEVAVLEEYADFVAERPEEVSVALGHIMKTANRFNFEIDHILERFSAHIPFQVVQKKRLYYKSPILAERQAQFFAELGKYKSKKNPATAIKIFLTGLELSVKINSVQNIANYMTLFELHREWATVEEKGQFRQLAREVDRLNAED